MIAIAMTASIITYIRMVSFLAATMVKSKHAIIQSVAFDLGADGIWGTNDDSLTIYVQNVGEGVIVITDVYVNRARCDVSGLPVTVNEGETVDLTIPYELELSQEIHVKIVCKDGISTEGTYTVKG